MDAYNGNLDAVQPGLVILDQERRVLMANKPAERMLGYVATDLIGVPVQDLLYCDHDQPCLLCMKSEEVQTALQGESLYGTQRYYSALIKNMQGQPQVYTCEVTSAGGGDQAAQIVLTLRPDNNNKAVIQQSRDLVALLAHQLRTYLTYIVGTAEALYGGYNHFESQEEALQFIHEQAEHSVYVLERGLELVRDFWEDIPLLEPVMLGPLIQQVIEDIEARFGPQTITVTPPSDLYVFGKQILIKLVLENLLQNTLTYSNENPAISIEVNQQQEMTIVSVIEHGKKLSEEQVQLIFQSMQQPVISSTGKRSHGLGLFLSKVAIEAQGGQMWVESEPTTGAQFHFSLPSYKP